MMTVLSWHSYFDILVDSSAFGLGAGAGWYVITALLTLGRGKVHEHS